MSTCDFNNNIPKQSNNDIHVSIFVGPETLLKKENLAKVFSCEFQENFNNTLLLEWKWKLKKGLIFAAILCPCSRLPTINVSDMRT